jgi:DNA recombination protein RmuC
MGFRSLAIEKRSSEVWKILGAVRNEFSKYNDVVEGLSRQLSDGRQVGRKAGHQDAGYGSETSGC